MAKTIEVDETQFLQSQEVTSAVRMMLGNPEARQLVLRAQKIIKPDAVIPEIDAKKEAIGEAKKAEEIALATQKELKDYLASQEAEKKTRQFADAWEGQKVELRRQGYTDEGITKVEEHAQKEGIPNLRAAAADWEKLNPPTVPATPAGYNAWNMFEPSTSETDEMKKLFDTRGDDEMVLRKMIGTALNDVRGSRR